MPTAIDPNEIDWAAQHEANIDFARDMLLSQNSVEPMFVIMTPTGVDVMGVRMPDSSADRDRAFAVVALWAASKNAFSITFMSEAWMRSVPKFRDESEATHLARATAVPVSEAEDREEVVIVSNVHRTDDGLDHTISVLDIVRDMDGTAVAAPQRANQPDEHFDGRLARLLPATPLSRAERARAAEIFSKLASVMGDDFDQPVFHAPGHA